MASILKTDSIIPNTTSYTTITPALLVSPIITGGLGLQVTKTADYTILDTDYYSTILVDPSARAINITLPSASSNTNRIITIKVTTKGGNVTVTGTLDGYTNMYLNRQNDYIDVISNGTAWFIKRCFCSYYTGTILTDDETNRHFGSSQLSYAAGSGSYIIGETITQETYGNTWIITADTGSVLTCKEASSDGRGYNGKKITGTTSGTQRTLNANTLNNDSYINHGLGKNIKELNRIHLVSTDGTDNNSFSIGSSGYDGSSYGAYNKTDYQVDTNNINLQTATGGFIIINSSGSQVQYTSTNLYYSSLIAYVK